MTTEFEVHTPQGSDLYPSPDERAMVERVIGQWETHDSDVGAADRRHMRKRVLKAVRIGYAARAETLEDAYERGYAAAENATTSPSGCCCGGC